MNLRGPVLGAIANRLITDLQRATVLSVMSITGSLVGMVVNLVLGAITDRSRPAAAVAAGGMLFVLGLAWLPVAARHIDQDAIRQVEGEECSSEPSPQPTSR